MLVRFTGGDFTELLNEQDKFILLVYFDGQDKNGDDMGVLSILPSTHDKFGRSQGNIIMETFSGVTYVETYHSEGYDLVIHLGVNYDLIWDDNGGHHRPLIIAVENGMAKNISFPQCYCIETYLDVIHSLHPELFEPPSVSES